MLFSLRLSTVRIKICQRCLRPCVEDRGRKEGVSGQGEAERGAERKKAESVEHFGIRVFIAVQSNSARKG